jgi:GNAT superfamily N-acetyltransferase
MEYHFRSATPSDAKAASEIIHAWDAEMDWMVPLDTVASMTEFWADRIEKSQGWVAEADGVVVGFCVRTDDNIDALYVVRAARGQGVGKRLLDLAKEDRDWITVWAYEANAEARRFYRREGLVEISREMETYEDGSSLMDVEHRWTRSG